MADRTPQDYAIEHAEYMACSAERLIEAVNNLALAEQQRDELEGDKPEGVVDASDHAVESAREALGDDMSALRNRIYEFRKRRDRAAATPPAGAQQAVADALNAYGDICFARGAGEWPNDPNRAVPDHKDHDRAFAAVLALTASAAAQRADCARCKGVGAVGDHNGERAVEISCDHCGGTGRAPSATPAPEAAPAEENKPVISVEDSLRTRLRWSEERVEQLKHENRELRGRIPGPSFDDLMGGVQASKKETTTASPGASKVFIVATGETHNGQETYTRHDVRPPLCDAEVLYTTPPKESP